MKTQKTHDWCVVYRTGGTSNFKWNRSLAMSWQEANASADNIERGGRTAYVVRYSQSMAIGLPSTYAGTEWETREAKKLEEMETHDA